MPEPNMFPLAAVAQKITNTSSAMRTDDSLEPMTLPSRAHPRQESAIVMRRSHFVDTGQRIVRGSSGSQKYSSSTKSAAELFILDVSGWRESCPETLDDAPRCSGGCPDQYKRININVVAGHYLRSFTLARIERYLKNLDPALFEGGPNGLAAAYGSVELLREYDSRSVRNHIRHSNDHGNSRQEYLDALERLARVQHQQFRRLISGSKR